MRIRYVKNILSIFIILKTTQIPYLHITDKGATIVIT